MNNTIEDLYVDNHFNFKFIQKGFNIFVLNGGVIHISGYCFNDFHIESCWFSDEEINDICY